VPYQRESRPRSGSFCDVDFLGVDTPHDDAGLGEPQGGPYAGVGAGYRLPRPSKNY